MRSALPSADERGASLSWPRRYDVFGVRVSATTYDEALEAVLRAARARHAAVVDHMPVHGLIEATRDAGFRAALDRFEIVAPDGQPVRWALNSLYDVCLEERVYGPEFMRRLCLRCAEEGLGVYLLGGHPAVLERLGTNLRSWFPRLRIVGAHSPPFRPLSGVESRRIAEQVNASGAAVVFLGLGCPKQELYADRFREQGLRAVQVCVGAAFDFHAGHKPMAPSWMQGAGLEWLFRLGVEPRRLWRRYLVTNSLFMARFGPRICRGFLRARLKAR